MTFGNLTHASSASTLWVLRLDDNVPIPPH
jgi:hypothetical protein